MDNGYYDRLLFSGLKKKFIYFASLMATLFSLSAFASVGNVLILYDSGGSYALLGKEHAIMLQNLLGHFDVTVTSKPVTQYTKGDVTAQLATFYIGSTYAEQSYYTPTSQAYINYNNFLADVATTTKTIVWMNYNLWQLAWSWKPAWGKTGFIDKFGISFMGTNIGGYNRVTYKGTELYKGVVPVVFPGAVLTGCIAEGKTSKTYDCSLEVNQVSIVNSSKATAYATTYSTVNANIVKTPYITKARNLWFIGDLPFSYSSEADRYMALADILHDMLGIQHPTNHMALIRFENVHSKGNVTLLNQEATYLASQNIPFSVATIADYRDPLGTNNGGIPQHIPLNLSLMGPTLKKLTKTLLPSGQKLASIVQEGTTHQFGNSPNPFTGASGEDTEFYRVIKNADNSLTYVGPVSGDSALWAKSRITIGAAILALNELQAFAWFAPNYIASQTDYQAIKSLYPVLYGRVVYFLDNTHSVDQFYPYLINKDVYGYKVIPENLGTVKPKPYLTFPPRLPVHLIGHAQKALVVRDGIASFYYDPSLGTTYLQQVVEGFKKLGYTFAAPCSLANAC